jgi:hypothetical protein
MKLNRLFVRSIPFALACSVAGAATVWSPITCGCVDPWQTIAWDIGRDDLKSSGELTAKVIADGLSRKLSGKPVNIRDLPISSSTQDCALSVSPTRTIRCRWWVWSSGEDQKGFDVIVFTNESGIFQHASVMPVTYIFAMHKPNQSAA